MVESFFGILKSEMFYGYEKSFQSLKQLEQAIVDYIDYYNNKRIKVKSWPPVKRVVCPRAISPNYQPAPKDAGFHFVQALLLLTRHLPLKEALVLLTTIPKGILIFFYT